MAETPNPIAVFLAEDSHLIRTRVAETLAAHAMTIVGQADSPRLSIEGILQSRPDVVVLDVQLEGGSGLQVMNAVRGIAPEIAFVVFSGNSGDAYRKRYQAAGATSFLDKSTEFDQLASAVTAARAAAADPAPYPAH